MDAANAPEGAQTGEGAQTETEQPGTDSSERSPEMERLSDGEIKMLQKKDSALMT